MTFQINYLSTTGNTAKIAHAIAGILPVEHTQLVDLSHQLSVEQADVHIIGFGVNRGAIPIKVIDLLDQLDNKVLLLFLTCGMEPTSEYQRQLQRKIEPFLPDVCNYRGMFLCRGRFPESIKDELSAILEEHPNNESARTMIKNYEQAFGHPNEMDIKNTCSWITEKLK